MSKIEPSLPQSSGSGVITYQVNQDDSLNDCDSFGTDIDKVTVPKRKTKQYEFHEFYSSIDTAKNGKYTLCIIIFIIYFIKYLFFQFYKEHS